jgi:hypothetical protein
MLLWITEKSKEIVRAKTERDVATWRV